MPKRTVFTIKERCFLVQLASKYPEISLRPANRQSLQRKSDAWQKIHNSFNAQTNFSFKTIQQLKRRWYDENKRKLHQVLDQTVLSTQENSYENKENISCTQKVKTEEANKTVTFTGEVDKQNVKVFDLSVSNLSELSASFKLQVDDDDEGSNSHDTSNESKQVNLSVDDQDQRNAEPVETADDEEDTVKVESNQSAMLSSSTMLEKLSKQRLLNAIKENERANELHELNLRTADVKYRNAMVELEIASKKLQQIVTQ